MKHTTPFGPILCATSLLLALPLTACDVEPETELDLARSDDEPEADEEDEDALERDGADELVPAPIS